MYSGPILKRAQTVKLQQHKYNSESLSYADAYMQKWWEFEQENFFPDQQVFHAIFISKSKGWK